MTWLVRPGVLRKRKAASKLDPDVIAQRFRAQRESMLEQVGVEWTDQASMSMKVKGLVEGLGVSSHLVAPYCCFGRELLAITKKFGAIKAGDESIEAIDVWTTRGLDREILNLIARNFGYFPVWKTPDRDLVMCLNFDRGVGAEALDISGFDNPGTINGALWSGEVGFKVFGKALNFDGVDDNVNVVGPGFDTHTVGSFSIWVYLRRLLFESCLMSYFENWLEYVHFFINAAGDLIARFVTGGVGTDYTVATGLTANSWFRVAVTQNGSVLRGYMNEIPGTPQVTPSWFHSVGVNAITDLRLGMIAIYAVPDGLLDEPRIYRRPLSPLENYDHYRVGALHLGRNV